MKGGTALGIGVIASAGLASVGYLAGSRGKNGSGSKKDDDSNNRAVIKLLQRNKNVRLPRYEREGNVSQRIGVTLTKGFYRGYMEDEFTFWQSKDGNYQIVGVYDGHGGARASAVAKENIVNNILSVDMENLPPTANNQQDEFVNISSAKPIEYFKQLFTKAYKKTEQDYVHITSDRPIGREGTTAVTALVRKEENDIIVANAGDSKCVVCRRKREFDEALSFDHKPSDPEESKRIYSNNGYVHPHVVQVNTPTGLKTVYMHRIYENGTNIGGLNLSRAIADTFYGEKVPSTPDVKMIKRDDEQDIALVLASDGLWDVADITEVCDVVRNSNEDFQKASDTLVDLAVIKQSSDNICTVVLGL